MVTIQETKMGDIHPKLIRTLWNTPDVEWTFSPVEGNSGGILLMWSKKFFMVSSSMCAKHWIAISGQITPLKWEVSLIAIYNSCTALDRERVWNDLYEFWEKSKLPCLIIGDFNEILSPSDRGSQLSSQSDIDAFKSFIQSMQLLEIPSKDKYTWFRGNSKSKLDRCFINLEWLTHFPSLKLSLINRGLSDHCPLLLTSLSQNWGPKPFKFQNSWLTSPSCMKLIKDTWQNSPPGKMGTKLKAVKKSLLHWNITVFGNIETKIKHFENEIKKMDEISNNRNLNDVELERKKSAQTEL